MALKRRCPDVGLLHHSDRGCTYASEDYQALLDAHGIVCSMSRRGNCYDNAVMESFFSTVKSELGDHFDSHGRGKVALFDYIEVFYNQRRRHSTLGQISPAAFERRTVRRTTPARARSKALPLSRRGRSPAAPARAPLAKERAHNGHRSLVVNPPTESGQPYSLPRERSECAPHRGAKRRDPTRAKRAPLPHERSESGRLYSSERAPDRRAKQAAAPTEARSAEASTGERQRAGLTRGAKEARPFLRASVASAPLPEAR